MIITEIAKYKGSTFAVTLDEGEPLYLHADLVSRFGLCEGMELTPEYLAEIRLEAEGRRAYERALYLLDARAYSFVELYEKLCPSYGEDTSLAVVKRLAKNGLINDREYARSMARRYVELKCYGMRRAIQEMRRRGLDSNTIANALLPYEDNVEERLLQVLSHKYARQLIDPSDRKAIDKVKAALVRMGYSYGEIQDAIAAYYADEEAS